jgi:hypothetical protein
VLAHYQNESMSYNILSMVLNSLFCVFVLILILLFLELVKRHRQVRNAIQVGQGNRQHIWVHPVAMVFPVLLATPVTALDLKAEYFSILEGATQDLANSVDMGIMDWLFFIFICFILVCLVILLLWNFYKMVRHFISTIFRFYLVLLCVFLILQFILYHYGFLLHFIHQLTFVDDLGDPISQRYDMYQNYRKDFPEIFSTYYTGPADFERYGGGWFAQAFQGYTLRVSQMNSLKLKVWVVGPIVFIRSIIWLVSTPFTGIPYVLAEIFEVRDMGILTFVLVWACSTCVFLSWFLSVCILYSETRPNPTEEFRAKIMGRSLTTYNEQDGSYTAEPYYETRNHDFYKRPVVTEGMPIYVMRHIVNPGICCVCMEPVVHAGLYRRMRPLMCCLPNDGPPQFICQDCHRRIAGGVHNRCPRCQNEDQYRNLFVNPQPDPLFVELERPEIDYAGYERPVGNNDVEVMNVVNNDVVEINRFQPLLPDRLPHGGLVENIEGRNVLTTFTQATVPNMVEVAPGLFRASGTKKVELPVSLMHELGAFLIGKTLDNNLVLAAKASLKHWLRALILTPQQLYDATAYGVEATLLMMGKINVSNSQWFEQYQDVSYYEQVLRAHRDLATILKPILMLNLIRIVMSWCQRIVLFSSLIGFSVHFQILTNILLILEDVLFEAVVDLFLFSVLIGLYILVDKELFLKCVNEEVYRMAVLAIDCIFPGIAILATLSFGVFESFATNNTFYVCFHYLLTYLLGDNVFLCLIVHISVNAFTRFKCDYTRRECREAWRKLRSWNLTNCKVEIEPVRAGAKIKLPTTFVDPFKTQKNQHLNGIGTGGFRPVAYAPNLNNEEVAVRKRILAETLEPDMEYLRRAIHWVERRFKKFFPYFGEISAVPFEKYLENSNASPSVKRTLRETYAKLQADGIDENTVLSEEQVRKWCKRKAFVKVENNVYRTPVGRKKKACRLIQGATPEFICLVGPWMMAFQKRMKKRWSKNNHICFTSGVSMLDAIKVINKHGKFLEDDIGAWDASVASQLLRMEYNLFKWAGAPPIVLQLIKGNINTVGVTSKGVSYSRNGMRKSGDPYTSCGNSFLNAVLHCFIYCDETNCSYAQMSQELFMIVQGDDNLLNEPGIFPIDWKDRMNALGFDNIAIPRRSLYDCEFCSCIVLDSDLGPVFTMKPGKVMAKLCYNVLPPLHIHPKQILRGMALGLYNGVQHCEPLKIYVDRLLQMTAGEIPKNFKMDDWKMRHVCCGNVPDNIYHLSQRYGSWGANYVEEFESMLSLCNYGDDLVSPLFQLFLNRDTAGPQTYPY